MVTTTPPNPSLYQINTRIWLKKLSEDQGQVVTFKDVPDDELDRLAEQGFNWIWLLGIWRTGDLGRVIARQDADLRRKYMRALPDLTGDDICSSPFAISAYEVGSEFGDQKSLLDLRERLNTRGMRLMLDFVPNHTARDHPWVSEHPEYYISGTKDDLKKNPDKYGKNPDSERIYAFGRDPFFPGWTDTFQLNYGNPDLQLAMIEQLYRIAALCDGVRCDMAMLLLPQVFSSTWGIPMEPFWPYAIHQVRIRHEQFIFMAEVYWDLEWHLQEQGFDYTYDKRLYDRLNAQDARSVKEHLFAGIEYQRKSVRFLENHDEPRAASIFPPQIHEAAALITYLIPGMRFFHQGQLSGKRVRIPMQLCRAPAEPGDESLENFYSTLLTLLKKPLLQDGDWKLLESTPAWAGNWTWHNFIAFSWSNNQGQRMLAVINYASHQGQCYISLPFPEFSGKQIGLRDVLEDVLYQREGDALRERGLYIDLPSWGVHIFEVRLEDG